MPAKVSSFYRWDLGLCVWVANVDADWGPEDTEVASGSAHLWEESWDDDDTSDDFSKQLKYENLLNGPNLY